MPDSRMCTAPADGRHPTVEISATVNGREVVRVVPNHYRLIDFVREELKLTGNKEGCGAGECGTCSMFLDGKLVKSCLTPVQKVDGAKVETVDDLDRDLVLQPGRLQSRGGGAHDVILTVCRPVRAWPRHRAHSATSRSSS